MQTLEQIVFPEGYFINNCFLTKAGQKKLEAFVDDLFDFDNWSFNGSIASHAFDVASDCVGSEIEPHYVISAEKSLTGRDEILRFVRDIDYVVELQSFEAYRLARLADELQMLHEVIEEELNNFN